MQDLWWTSNTTQSVVIQNYEFNKKKLHQRYKFSMHITIKIF